MDNSWPDREKPERFSLMAFIVGKDADALSQMPGEVRKAKVLKHLAELFEVDEAFLRGQLVDEGGYHEGGWGARAWSGGCPGAFFPPNTFVQHGPELRRTFGRVHWAGAETATDWVGGYMNGALQSGIRAAEEVLRELA
jgi:monoamine oxidase